jgi:hypothetical protein
MRAEGMLSNTHFTHLITYGAGKFSDCANLTLTDVYYTGLDL